MTNLRELYASTRALYDHLLEDFPKEDEKRDNYIEKVNQLLDQREQLMTSLQPPSTSGEKKVAQEIFRLNKEIQEKLKTNQQRIQTDINQLNQKKNTGRRYENPYDGPTPDGVFFDSKK
ncbi:hypothetical protein [Alkalicoccus daliensis]|uniref:Flagellar protein FliT n=1 Tax=Alkalicoccus daliensis TaxID=745820 RepID=A0A1H0JNX1_9BACI|nr:hypothetical protein [Alkalicoccus daliensis]SDO45189.1 flagellar protein FliT [Alkalicoccus daliensis]